MGLVFIAVGVGKRCCFVVGIDSCFGDEPLVMSIGAIIWNNITQDLTQYGGLVAPPCIRLAFVVSAAGLLAFPPLGSFWALLKLADGLATQPGLVGVLLVVNALTAFSLTRVFSLILAVKPNR